MTVEGWVKIQGQSTLAWLAVECQNPQQYKDSRNYGVLLQKESKKVNGPVSWTKIALDIDVPAEATKILIFAAAAGESGKVQFDDLKAFWIK